MRDLLIVDDQKAVRDALKSLLLEMDLDIGAILQAGDCRSAIEIIDRCRPDIVFLDIMMGNRSGFEVAHYVSDRQLPCYIIIMTAYPEFHFAMEALHCKVCDFIVKPITRESILNAVHTIERSNSLQNKQIISLNRQQMYYFLLLDQYMNSEDVRVSSQSILGKTGLSRLHPSRTIAIIMVGPEGSSLLTAASDALAEQGCGLVCYPSADGRLVFFAGFSHTPGDTEIERIGKAISGIPGVMAGCSLVSDEGSFRTRYQQAAMALEYARDNGLTGSLVMLPETRAAEWIFSRHRVALAEAIDEKSTALLKQTTEPLFVEFEKRNIAPNIVAKLLGAFLAEMTAFSGELPRDDYFSIKSTLLNILLNANPHCPRPNPLPSKIQEAVLFVQKHYGRDISLAEIAEHLDINYYYLSNLFKKYMDIGFVEYLNRFRLEKAAQLLLTTRYPVAHIAQITGYENARYFYKRFKAHYRQTPREYREIRSNARG